MLARTSCFSLYNFLMSVSHALGWHDMSSRRCVHVHSGGPFSTSGQQRALSACHWKPQLISYKAHPFFSAQQLLQTHQHTYTNTAPLLSTANTHTHTLVYLVCGPLYLHRHDEVCITNRLQGEHRGRWLACSFTWGALCTFTWRYITAEHCHKSHYIATKI